MAERHIWFWRYGFGVGRYGHWGLYLGIPLLGDAWYRRSRYSRGFRWAGVFRVSGGGL